MTSIGEAAFQDCTSLETITFQGMQEQWNVITKGSDWDKNAGKNTAAGKYTLAFDSGEKASEGLEFTLNDDGKSYSVSGIGSCTDTEVVIPSAYNGFPVTEIGKRAFSGCSGLTAITIPDSVTHIGGWAFYRCVGLTSIIIPGGVTSIGNYAFSGCSGLTSITIPDRVTSIGDDAFGYCSGMTSVTIGKGVTSIGDNAFSGCIHLTLITVADGNTT